MGEYNITKSFLSYRNVYGSYGYLDVSGINQHRKLYLSNPHQPETFFCISCFLYKLKYITSNSIYKWTSEPFNLIQTDLFARFSKNSLGGKEYYIILINNRTSNTRIYFLEKRSNAEKAIQCKKMVQTQLDVTHKVLFFYNET